MTKVILYTRVSTEDQVRGYSLRQQAEALREHCSSNGYEVIEEISDEGYSGAYLERPGIDRMRDIVETGEVDLVLAQDRDRISREPALLYLLAKDFVPYGTRIKALNQHGDDSAEGHLTDGIIDQIAKYERAKMAERTKRGKRKKAKEGKMVGTGVTNYGFRLENDHYVIDPEEMEVVGRIFHLLAEGNSFYDVVKFLNSEGVTRRGKPWLRQSMRNFVMNDVYKPHTVSELAPYLTPEVLSSLDPDKSYGIYWYGRERKTYTTVSEAKNGKKEYKTKVRTEQTPREEWIAIPVPSSLPRGIVEKARNNVSEKVWKISMNADRFWELSGGIVFCSECGRRLAPKSTSPRNSEKTYYY
jgi:site-specific DNA recombinase